MHTNTSRILTAFSDLPHDGDLVFPSGRDVLDYLHRYARMFDLESRLRCDTRVEAVTRCDQGWLVCHDGKQETLNLDAGGFDADRYTFHPDLPGLAFMGMWDQSGGYFVPLELQARWVAYTWGGAIAPPDDAAQRVAIATYRARRGMPQKTRMNVAAIVFARAAGVEPALENWPQLRRALLFGPLAPSSFRLEGPDALADAPARFARDAATFGAITSNELTARERDYLALLIAPSDPAPPAVPR